MRVCLIDRLLTAMKSKRWACIGHNCSQIQIQAGAMTVNLKLAASICISRRGAEPADDRHQRRLGISKGCGGGQKTLVNTGNEFEVWNVVFYLNGMESVSVIHAMINLN